MPALPLAHRLTCAVAAASLLFLPACRKNEAGQTNASGTLIHSVTSEFSQIRVREKGSVRNLIFVEPNGREVSQSSIDLTQPGRLMHRYTEVMFTTLLFKQPQHRVLIVGLGGGGMIRFINRHFPKTQVDAVEIDPVVVRLADEFFDTRPGPATRIFTEDALLYLQRNHGQYDAIYMDAFLEPGSDTDANGIPKKLKTIEFLKSLHRHLKPGGVIAFNIIGHPRIEGDLDAISAAFPTVFVASVPGTNNHVAIAQPNPSERTPADLRQSGLRLDQTLKVGVSFEKMADLLKKRSP